MGIDLILDMGGALGERVALGRRADGVTFAELDRAAAGGAAVLGASRARSVAFVGLNGPVLPALVFAAARAGIPVTPLNYRLSAAQLAELLGELDAPYIVADNAFAEIVPTTTPSEEWLDLACRTESAPPARTDDFDAGDWLRLVREDKVTHAMVVPTMLARIVAELDGRSAGTAALRSIAYGGARMPPTVLRAALTAFPGADFVNAYGLTETSSTIAILGPDDHRAALGGDPVALARLGSVGRLVPGVQCQIRADDGQCLPPDGTGEIWVRGGQVSGEYRGIGSVLDDDGWFPTRDRGRLDTDGYLFVEGRSDDTIIRGGENIAPAEIEDVLMQHPAVDQVAVLGAPDEEWGERVVAVIVPAAGAGPDPDDIRASARARLRSARTPDDVVFRTELPYTPTGKVLRRELARQIA